MSRVKIFLFLQFIIFSAVPVLAQVDTAWVARYNGPGNAEDVAHALAVDDSGNVYVTGDSWNGTSSDYATIKYDSNGDTLWVRHYNRSEIIDDHATALAVDGSGNVYVTGFSGTIKYSANGDSLWISLYPECLDLAVDDSGNIYVTGSGGLDYRTIKYDSNGDTLWVRLYNGSGELQDNANALAVDDSGNVYVTGQSAFDYATIKYDSNGDTLWVRRYNGPGNGGDNATALAVDDSGNVYVTGYSWNGTSSDYATIKYDSNGDTLWVRRYNGPGDGDDNASTLAVDDSGNVYVTGQSVGSGTDYDYATIKYNSNGDTLWVRRYNGEENTLDLVSALAVDATGNVFVTGASDFYFSFPICCANYATIKYNSDGDTQWVSRYNGAGNDLDGASALAVDDSGNVYVTGQSAGSGTSSDYATIKYVQFACVDTAGDANGDGGVSLPDIIYEVNRVFKGGPAPSPLCRGDANADGVVNLPDIIYLVNRVFKGGPKPLKSRECCL